MASTQADVRPRDIDEALLDHSIEQDPHDPGRHHARLTNYGHHVWAVISYLKSSDWDIEATTTAFAGGSAEAIYAAIRYYERYRDLIDAKLLLEEKASYAWHG